MLQMGGIHDFSWRPRSIGHSPTGDLPSRRALLDLPEYKNNPLLAPCMESMKRSVPAPWTTRRLDDELIRKAYQLVTLKGETPAAALKWLTTEGVQAEKEQQELAKAVSCL